MNKKIWGRIHKEEECIALAVADAEEGRKKGHGRMKKRVLKYFGDEKR